MFVIFILAEIMSLSYNHIFKVGFNEPLSGLAIVCPLLVFDYGNLVCFFGLVDTTLSKSLIFQVWMEPTWNVLRRWLIFLKALLQLALSVWNVVKSLIPSMVFRAWVSVKSVCTMTLQGFTHLSGRVGHIWSNSHTFLEYVLKTSIHIQLLRWGCFPFSHKSLKRYIKSGRISAFCPP